MTNVPISTTQLPSAEAIVETLSRSLDVVMGWQEVEVPSRWVPGTGDMRKLTIRVRNQPISFINAIQQSLITAKHGQGLCETGLKASEVLLDKSCLDCTEQEKSRFTKTRLHELKKSASALNEETNGMKIKFRTLRTGMFEIHERLNIFTNKRERGTIIARLSRLSKDVRTCEAELQDVYRNLDEVERTLNLITNWWEKIEADTNYLQMSGESSLAAEKNRILMKEIENGFTTLKEYFADYVEKMSVFCDRNLAKLNEENRKCLQRILNGTDSVVPNKGQLESGEK